MVAAIEVAVLVLLALLFYIWFRGTNMHRAHRDHGGAPGQYGTRVQFGMYQQSQPPQVAHALHGYERRRRRRWFTRRSTAEKG